MEIALKPRSTSGSLVTRVEHGWRLEIPSGGRNTYRLAQLDDYVVLSRRSFRHAPPWTINLQAKISAPDLPGTWGFGLWNDPFGFSLGFGRTEGRLPVLPNAAWFFHASPPNWLSLHTGIPARGFFAGSINSPHIPSLLFAPALLTLPLLAVRPLSRFLRKMAARIVRQDAVEISVDVTQYHEYSISWLREVCLFKIDGKKILETPVSPIPPLGLVFWVDNQFATWDPKGHLAYGTLDNPASTLDINSIEISG
ncbi:MAG: hypothetical protein ACXWNC_06560 [Anaerolineales bacterium]